MSLMLVYNMMKKLEEQVSVLEIKKAQLHSNPQGLDEVELMQTKQKIAELYRNFEHDIDNIIAELEAELSKRMSDVATLKSNREYMTMIGKELPDSIIRLEIDISTLKHTIKEIRNHAFVFNEEFVSLEDIARMVKEGYPKFIGEPSDETRAEVKIIISKCRDVTTLQSFLDEIILEYWQIKFSKICQLLCCQQGNITP